MHLMFDRIAAKPALDGGTWTPLQAPDDDAALMLSFPIALCAAFIVGLIWALSVRIVSTEIDTALLIGTMALLGPLHELVHIAALPKALRIDRAALILWPSRLILTAHFDGTMRRSAYLRMLVMPLAILSLVPLGAAMIVGHAPASWVLLSLLNVAVSSGDLLALVLVLGQVPAGALVRRARDVTEWKWPNDAPPVGSDPT